MMVHQQLIQQQVPEDERVKVMREQFSKAVAVAEKGVYGKMNVTDEEVRRAHKAYASDPQVKQHGKVITECYKLLCEKMPEVPAGITLEKAIEIARENTEGQTSAIMSTIEATKQKLGIASDEEFKTIIKTQGHPKQATVMAILGKAVNHATQLNNKKLMAKYKEEGIGEDSRVLQAIMNKFASNPDFMAAHQQNQMKQQQALTAIGLQ